MYRVKLLNKIDKVGLDQLDPQSYTCGEDVESPDAILVRSAKMHDMEFEKNLLCIGRAGAGTNNIPVDRCAEEGIVVFNTPGANANAVKELAICGLLMASRKIVAGNRWVMEMCIRDRTCRGRSPGPSCQDPPRRWPGGRRWRPGR